MQSQKNNVLKAKCKNKSKMLISSKVNYKVVEKVGKKKICVYTWKEFFLPPIWHVSWASDVHRQKYVYKKRCEEKDGNVYIICNSAHFANK